MTCHGHPGECQSSGPSRSGKRVRGGSARLAQAQSLADGGADRPAPLHGVLRFTSVFISAHFTYSGTPSEAALAPLPTHRLVISTDPYPSTSLHPTAPPCQATISHLDGSCQCGPSKRPWWLCQGSWPPVFPPVHSPVGHQGHQPKAQVWSHESPA